MQQRDLELKIQRFVYALDPSVRAPATTWAGPPSGPYPDGYSRDESSDDVRAGLLGLIGLAGQVRRHRTDELEWLRVCGYDTGEARALVSRADALIMQLGDVMRAAEQVALLSARADEHVRALRTSGSQPGEPPVRGTPIAEPDRHSGDASQTGARAQPRARRAATRREPI